LVNRLYRQTKGKECGSKESSRLWGGALRDEPKTAAKETSLRAAVFKIDASHLEMTNVLVIGTHLVHVGNLKGLLTLSPMKLLALLTNPRQ